jgi:hypothetical protein
MINRRNFFKNLGLGMGVAAVPVTAVAVTALTNSKFNKQLAVPSEQLDKQPESLRIGTNYQNSVQIKSFEGDLYIKDTSGWHKL